MPCPDCEALGLDHEEVQQRCRESLFVTARFLCGFEDMTTSFHKKVCDRVQDLLRSGVRNILCLLPRGHLKTHMLTIAGVIWLLINDPNRRALLLQASGKKATDNIDIISAVLNSEQFLHFFSDLIPEKKDRWNKNELEICRLAVVPEASVSARGIKSRIVGGHYNVIIFDDPVDLLDVDSDVTMDDAIQAIVHSTPMLVNPSVDITIVIGTRWSDSDPYGYIKRNLPMFAVIEAGCYVDERCFDQTIGAPGEPLWKERFSREVLEEIRAKVGDWVFAHQYENLAMEESMRRFKPPYPEYTWIEQGVRLQVDGREIYVDKLFRTLTVDPSVGESKGSDDSAIVVTGFEARTGNVYVLDAWAERVIMPTLIEQMMKMQGEWKPHIFGIEAVGFQKTLKYPLRQQMAWQNQHFGITELKTGKESKPLRIEALPPYFQNRQVYLGRNQNKLANQLSGWHPGASGHDDLLDALAYHVRYWKSSLPTISHIPTVSDEDIEELLEQKSPIYGLAACQ